MPTEKTTEKQIEPPRLNPQMRQRQERIEYVISRARKHQPQNARELADLIENLFPGIGGGTRNSYARAANKILKLPYTTDFPEV